MGAGLGAADLVHAEIEDPADVRMTHPARQQDLALETLDRLRIAARRRTEHLERHAAAQMQVLGAIDLARGALAEVARDPVARRDDLAEREDRHLRRSAHAHLWNLTLPRLYRLIAPLSVAVRIFRRSIGLPAEGGPFGSGVHAAKRAAKRARNRDDTHIGEPGERLQAAAPVAPGAQRALAAFATPAARPAMAASAARQPGS